MTYCAILIWMAKIEPTMLVSERWKHKKNCEHRPNPRYFPKFGRWIPKEHARKLRERWRGLLSGMNSHIFCKTLIDIHAINVNNIYICFMKYGDIQ